MQQNFTIEGMTCNNCKKGVIASLSALDIVKEVSVDLESGHTQLQATQKIELSEVQNVLGTKYKVLVNQPQKASKLTQLFPLFLILSYVLAATFFLSKSNFTAATFMANYMGLFFIVFGFFKLLDYKGFPDSFAQYDPLAKRSRFYGQVYPFLETALGICFLFQYELSIVLWITVVVLGITTIGVIQSLVYKREITCACLGTVLKLPMTQATLIENSSMIVMAIAMLLTAS